MSNREIVVKGIGKISAAPDFIVLTMTLEVVEPDYEKTMRRSGDLLEALRSAIASVGHDGKLLKTTSFKINTKYERYKKNDTWKQRFNGYACTQELRLEFDLDMSMLGMTLRAIAECDAEPIFNIQFSIKDQNVVSEQLLIDAVENAKWKASVLAKSAGAKLGAIQRIDYNWSELRLYSDTNINMLEAAPAYSARSSTIINIQPEDIKVRDTATVVWAIE